MAATELQEVLFFRNIAKLCRDLKEIEDLYYPDELEKLEDAQNNYIYDTIKNKENLLRIVDDYSQNGLPVWQGQESQNCRSIDKKALTGVFMRGTAENGAKSYNLYENMKEKWACHLDDYAALVNCKDDADILELGTGAGLDTCAVMKSMPPNSRIISVDINFSAAKNADGLARYLKIDNRAFGLNASFWNLPFADGLFDTVCTHYGLDESRELPTTLSQISRVLKHGGKFIGVSRKRPYDRQKHVLKMFGIVEEECNVLLEKVRLYSGFENLKTLTQNYNLILDSCKEYIPKTSHSRVLFQFTKIQKR